MLPLIIATAHDEALLSPDDLGTNFKALLGEALRDRRGPESRVPDIKDVAAESRPRRTFRHVEGPAFQRIFL